MAYTTVIIGSRWRQDVFTAGTIWMKSGRCTGHGEDTCVELAPDSNSIRFRDSKDPAGPVLIFGMDDVISFFAQIDEDRETGFAGVIQVSQHGKDYQLYDSRSSNRLTFNRDEMVAFYGGVRDGNFDILLRQADPTITSVLVRI